MLMPILTKNGLVVLSGGAVALLVPIVTTVPAKAGFLVASVVVVVFILLAARDAIVSKLFFRSLSVEWQGSRRFWFGVPAVRKLNCVYRKQTRFSVLEVNTNPPHGFESQEVLALGLRRGETGQICEVSFIPYRRGDHAWREIWLRLTSKGSMLSFQKRIETIGLSTATVVPNPRAASESEELVAQKRYQTGSHRYLAGLRGREFDGLRRYQPGDDTRHIDWKRSARGTGLVLKTYRPETHQRVTVALDCGRRMSSRLGKILQLDAAVDATARLVRTAVSNNDEIGCFAFSNSVQTHVRVGKGYRQEEVILRALQGVQSSLVESDYTLLSDWIGTQRRRSLLVLITSFSNAKSFDSIRWVVDPAKSRHLILIVIIADRELDALANVSAQDLEDAYAIAAAQEQLSDLKKQMTMMRRSGFECIYADAEDIGRHLHDAYLRCKESGRL